MEKQDHAKIKTIPPLIPLLAIGVCWALDRYVYALQIPLSTSLQSWIAYACIAIATLLFTSSLYYFFKYKQNPEPHTPTQTLYTSGIYAYSRNPIYLGFLFAQVVVAIKLNNLYIVFTLPLVGWLLNEWIIKPEEIYLQQRFGMNYLEYKNKVRRWV